MENLVPKAHRILTFLVKEFNFDSVITVAPLDDTLVITEPQYLTVNNSGERWYPFEKSAIVATIGSVEERTKEWEELVRSTGNEFIPEATVRYYAFVKGLGLPFGENEHIILRVLALLSISDYRRRYSRLPVELAKPILSFPLHHQYSELLKQLGGDRVNEIETHYPELGLDYDHEVAWASSFVFTHFYPMRNKLVEQGIID